jgi:hypothetical protein
VEALLRWLLWRFGDAVLDWTVRQLADHLQGEQLPHGDGCECGCVLEQDFDADELGIDPEAEGWDTA